MIRKILVIILVVLIGLEVTGCGPLKKKFTRKKKKEIPPPVYYELEKYSREPNIVLYKRHYIYWKTWQEELINKIGDKYKKDIRYADGIISNLQDMRRLLVKEKGDELAVFIDEMKKIKTMLNDRSLRGANKIRIKNTLEKRYRKIKREFSYTKVEDYVLEDVKPPEAPQSAKKEAKKIEIPQTKKEEDIK